MPHLLQRLRGDLTRLSSAFTPLHLIHHHNHHNTHLAVAIAAAVADSHEAVRCTAPPSSAGPVFITHILTDHSKCPLSTPPAARRH